MLQKIDELRARHRKEEEQCLLANKIADIIDAAGVPLPDWIHPQDWKISGESVHIKYECAGKDRHEVRQLIEELTQAFEPVDMTKVKTKSFTSLWPAPMVGALEELPKKGEIVSESEYLPMWIHLDQFRASLKWYAWLQPGGARGALTDHASIMEIEIVVSHTPRIGGLVAGVRDQKGRFPVQYLEWHGVSMHGVTISIYDGDRFAGESGRYIKWYSSDPDAPGTYTVPFHRFGDRATLVSIWDHLTDPDLWEGWQ